MCGRISLGLGAEDLEDLINEALYREEEEDQEEEEEEAAAEQEEEEERPQQQRGDDEGNEDNLDQEQNQPQKQKQQQQRNKQQQLDDIGRNRSNSPNKAVKAVAFLNQITKDSYRPRFNVAPQSRSVIIKRNNHINEIPDAPISSKPAYVLELAKWGLIPSWTKSPPEKPLQTINCREDTLKTPGSIWASMKDKKRAVIPCEGFYEWQTRGKDKLPFFTKMKPDGRIMMFAGLFDEVTYDDFDSVQSFTIITTETNSQLRFLHNRMPAILSTPEEIQLWLSDAPFNQVQHLLKPYKGMLTCYKVPLEVGSVRNDSPEFIRPVSERKGNIGAMFAKQTSSQSPTKPTTLSSSSAFASTSISTSTSPPSKAKPITTISKNSINKSQEGDMRLNPDEKLPSTSASSSSSNSNSKKSPQIIVEEEQEEKEDSKGKGKRKVEVIELSSDGEEDNEDIIKGNEKPKATTSSPTIPSKKSKKQKVKKVEVPEDGTPTLGNFFKKDT